MASRSTNRDCPADYSFSIWRSQYLRSNLNSAASWLCILGKLLGLAEKWGSWLFPPLTSLWRADEFVHVEYLAYSNRILCVCMSFHLREWHSLNLHLCRPHSRSMNQHYLGGGDCWDCPFCVVSRGRGSEAGWIWDSGVKGAPLPLVVHPDLLHLPQAVWPWGIYFTLCALVFSSVKLWQHLSIEWLWGVNELMCKHSASCKCCRVSTTVIIIVSIIIISFQTSQQRVQTLELHAYLSLTHETENAIH